MAHSAADFCYTYNAGYFVVEYAYGEVANEGQSGLLPLFWGDGYFSQAGTSYSSTLDRALRQECWWTLAAGARGILFESEAVYPWTVSSCVTAVTGSGSRRHNLGNIAAFISGLAGGTCCCPTCRPRSSPPGGAPG